MTRKTSTDKDGGKASKSEGRDYMKLKTMIEEFVDGDCKDYNEEMDDVIHDITVTGIVRMPWKLLKPLLRFKMEKILKESFEETDLKGSSSSKQVIELLDKFNGPPFTIQRLCELIKEPRKSYRRRDKYIHALQKNLLVVSTQEPDLIWMKVPNLSLLLDPKSAPTIPMPTAATPDPINEKELIMSRDLPSPSWKLPRSPISPRSPRSPRSRTPPPDFESSFVGRNWEGLLEPHPILFRKRTSSLKEVHSDLHVQLQEADSTVPDQPLLTTEEVGKPLRQKRHRSSIEEDSGILKTILGASDLENLSQSKVHSNDSTTTTSSSSSNSTKEGESNNVDSNTSTVSMCEAVLAASVDSSKETEGCGLESDPVMDDHMKEEVGVADRPCDVGDQSDTVLTSIAMETS